MTLNEKPTVTIVDTFELIAKVVLFICYTVAVIWVTTLFCDHKPYEQEIMRLKQSNAMLRDSIYQRTLLTWDNVIFWAEYFELAEPKIVMAQIIQEVGWDMDSKMVIENNNLINMKLAERRPTTAMGQRNGHAYYANYIECLKDIRFREIAYYKPGTDYFQYLLNSGFAEDTAYIKSVKIIYEKIK